MLSVALSPTLPLNLVVRTPDIYIVPRTTGPHAGRAIIGATMENVGFDKTVHPSDITRLRTLAAELLPPLATAPQLEAWAGLRPATPDGLPLLGQLSNHPRHLLATGHFRDGILLAPATAHLITQLLTNESPTIDLTPFSPTRQIPATA
jgi:glycine oxidase